MIVHFSAHILKWELVCKFGVRFQIFIIIFCSVHGFMYETSDFLLYNNLFIYQVLFTLIYRRHSLYSFLANYASTGSYGACSAYSYYLTQCWHIVHWPLGTHFTEVTFKSNYNNCHTRKWTWICHLQNGGHFVELTCLSTSNTMKLTHVPLDKMATIS